MTAYSKPQSHKVIGIILASLSQSRMTASDLAAVICITIKSVHRYIRLLRAERRIYVVGYRVITRSNGATLPVALFAVGDKPDAQMPVQSHSAANKRHYRKLKLDDHRYDRYLARKRAYELVPKHQTELAYFFGRVAG